MKKTYFIFALVAVTGCGTINNKGTSDQTDSVKTSTVTAANTDLFGSDWKLQELHGKRISVDTTFKKGPGIFFEKGAEKISGNGGCNSFSGTYKLRDKNGIELSLGGATMMACPNLELEGQFLEALKQVKGYRIEGSSLFLENDKKELLAKFNKK